MYTTHSLSEMQMTSRSPTLHVPREASCEFDRDALVRGLRELEHGRARQTASPVIRRLVCAVLGRFGRLLPRVGESDAAPRPGHVST